MATRVSDVVLAPATRPEAVRRLSRVVDEEVAGKRGISGSAVRAAYAAVRRIDRGVVPRAIDEMLPEFARALEPFWAQREGLDFGAYLAGRSAEVAEALLGVTDAVARETHHAALALVYHTLRPHAVKDVAAALPRLGGTLDSLMATAGGPHGAGASGAD